MASSVEILREQMQQIIQLQQELLQKQLKLQKQLQQLEMPPKQKQQLQPEVSASLDDHEKDNISSSDNKTNEVIVNSHNLGLLPAYVKLDNHQQNHPAQEIQQHHTQQQQQFFSQYKHNSCSYYMRLRHMGEHPEGMYTTYSPEWYIGNLGFRASQWQDNNGKSYCAALHLSYFSMDTTVPFTKTTVKCKVTLMDPSGRQQDCLLAERESVFDGSRQVVDEWARGCVMVRIKMKDIKERGMCSDYTLLIRYDVDISV